MTRAVQASTPWRVAAGVAAAVGVVLPVGPTAAWIAGHGGLAGPEIAAGLWWWKGALLLAAAGLVFVGAPAPVPETSDRDSVRPPVARWEAGVLAGILTVALAVRFVDLDVGIWFDEITTWLDYVDASLPAVVTTYDSQNNHIFYSVLARISFLLFGDGVAQLRLPAVLFGVASVAAAWNFARRVVSPPEALLVAGALALSYHHVWFSQNARGYTGLLLFTLLSSSAFLDLLAGRGDPRRGVLRYALFAAMGVYLHLTGIFTVLGHGVAWLGWQLRHRDRALRWPLTALVASGVVSFVAYAPVLPQLLDTLLHSDGFRVRTEWQGVGWLLAETVRGLARGLPGGVVTVVAAVGIAAVGVARLLRARPMALAMMIAPGVICTVALLATDHNLWPRFYFFLAGFGVMIGIHGGVGVTRIALGDRRGERVAWGLATAALVIGALLVPRAWGPKQDYAGAADWLDAEATPHVVAVVGLTVRPYREFLDRDWPELTSEADLRRIESGGDPVRVIVTIPVELEAAHAGVWARLQDGYVEERRFPGSVAGGDIVVYRREPT